MIELVRDVAIIGAGPAGLSAANLLREEGFTVRVFEARGRVGGRTRTDDIEGRRVEIGGQWFSPDQDVLIETLHEYGLDTFPRYRDGDSVYLDAAAARRFGSGALPVDTRTVAEMDRLTALIDKLAAELDVRTPWTHPRAAELDTISLHHWLRQQSDDESACANIGIFVAGGMLTKPAHAFSALQAIAMAASAGSFSNLVDEDFVLDRRVRGGMQQLSQAMAERLQDDVHLNAPVTRVRWTDDQVEVFAEETVVRAQAVVVAVPPNLYSRITFDPPLPREFQLAHQHQSMGSVIKAQAVYASPFWREEGLSGTGFSATDLVQEVYDNSEPDEMNGVLVAFITDEKADQAYAAAPDERRALILASLARFFGEEAMHPLVYIESDWGADEWTQGAYGTSFDLGGLHRFGHLLRQPIGPIYWASSDLAAEGYLHVDGALRMGREAATLIASSLTAPSGN